VEKNKNDISGNESKTIERQQERKTSSKGITSIENQNERDEVKQCKWMGNDSENENKCVYIWSIKVRGSEQECVSSESEHWKGGWK
jgi:hypothetical protein